MRLVFMGTPDFAVPSLQALVRGGHQVLGVFTQPDRPAGRGKQLKPSPVKVAALELGLPVFQPEKIKSPESSAQLWELQPECIVVVAYGQILSREILHIPPRGCVNVHASLLPFYRGAAPIHWAVLNGEAVTGVTTMLMNEGLDTGDMLLKQEYPITPEATTGEVHDALAGLGGELILETLRQMQEGTLQPEPQTGPTNYAPLLKREHEEVDWSRGSLALHNQIRGLNPWPGAFTLFRGEGIKIWRSSLLTAGGPEETGMPLAGEYGEVLQVKGDGIVVGTGDGALLISEVQPAGKRAMPARDFFLGRHGQAGEKFGESYPESTEAEQR